MQVYSWCDHYLLKNVPPSLLPELESSQGEGISIATYCQVTVCSIVLYSIKSRGNYKRLPYISYKMNLSLIIVLVACYGSQLRGG